MRSKRLSEIIALPLGDPTHASIRDELRLIDAEHACRYYLSVLNQRDYFDVDHEAFHHALMAFLVRTASPLTRCWSQSRYCCDFALPFIRERFYQATGFPHTRKLTKADRALILLLNHPDWDDDVIIAELKTTAQQLARWTTFQLARREQHRSRTST